MSDRVSVVVERVDSLSNSLAVCVIRCLHGTLVVGQQLRTIDQESDQLLLEGLITVVGIWRYDKVVEIVDAPHIAKISLTGSVELVASATRLVGDSD